MTGSDPFWRTSFVENGAREVLRGPQGVSLFLEVVREGIADVDQKDAWAGGGSAPLTLFDTGAIAGGCGSSFLFFSSNLFGLKLISAPKNYIFRENMI